MTSVILPTREWTATAANAAAEIGPDDELLVVCDADDDPVADSAPDDVTVIPAGEPEDCAGKAHALATGMEAAEDDVVVWSDDDVDREEGWVNRLAERAREHDAATEVPVFVGGGLWRLLEPAVLLVGTLGVASEDHVWGGGVAFDRTAIDEAAFLTELRQTVGDDTLLSRYVEDVWADTDRLRSIRVDGSLSGVYHRFARYAKAPALFEPVQTAVLLVVLFLFAAAATLFPLPALALGTAVGAAAYWHAGVRRWSVLISFPSLFLLGPLLVVGVLAPTFDWGGRTYRWRRKFDVTVVS